jgi:hypothetical protein
VQDLHQAARAKLTTGELGVGSIDLQLKDLEAAIEKKPTQQSHRIEIREAAFGSNCGFSPWTNALFGALASLLLAIPYIIYEEISIFSIDASTFADNDISLIDMVGVILYLLRWTAYGLVFGYFYPLLRGRTPISKAIMLWIAILPIEIIPLFDAAWEPDNLLQAAAIRTGQLLVFTMGLGLAWEVRIMRTADLPWSALRNIRNLRSLGPLLQQSVSRPPQLPQLS